MEDLNLDDEPLPKLSSEGVGSLRSILIARESGTLGRLPPRCISSRYATCKTTTKQTLNFGNSDFDTEDTTKKTPKTKKPCMVGLDRLAQEAAEERLAGRELKVSECELRGRQTRSAFLVVFSPDRELMASTHGDHNIYVSQVSNGKCISTLKGHPRTPWCVAFHPTRKWLLASGCLGGHVRLWDLMGDGSEVWRADGVVASLAFHPTDRLLVIATFNELHFWDWSRNLPFAKVTTASEKEKVRYVKFDALGHQLITGIANLSGRDAHAANVNANLASSQQHSPNYLRRSFEQNFRSDYTFIPPRLRGNTTNAETDSTYGLTAYGRYRSYMSGINPTYPTLRRERERSEIRNQTSSQTSPRPAYPINSSNSAASSFRDTEIASTSQSNDPSRNSEADENGDRNSSASQTLSDLAAAASNRLMAENAAENAASHQTTRSILTSDSQHSNDSYPDRHNFIGALRSSSDPFFGVSPSNQSESSSNRLNSSLPTNQWASNEEMEAIRQSQIHQLRTFRSYEGPQSPPLLPSDIDNMLRQNEDNSRLRDYNSSFSHSPESSFIEVHNSSGNGRSIGVPQYNGTNRTQVYARSTARARAQERYREISERRLRRRMLGRRQALVSQIEELRNARDYLIDIDRRNTSALLGRGNGPEAAISTPEQLGQGNHEASATSSLGTSNLEQEVANTYNGTNRQDGAQTRESRAETRAIDDWARARRRRLESYRRRNLQSDSYQIRRSYNHFGALNNALNRRHATNRDNQTNTQFETNRTREQGNITETHNQITAETVDNSNNTELSSRIIEPEVVALPESSRLTTVNSRSNSNLDIANEGSSDGHIHEWSLPNTSLGILTDNDDNSHNDHTYSNLDTDEVESLRSETREGNRVERNANELSIQTDDIQTDDSGVQSNEHSSSDVRRDTTDITLPGGSTESNSAASRSNLDIILLSRHIDHMQRICRASLADCALNRHRRQVVRLQSIRRMLEDLQRQIRCLRAASNEELSRRSREAESLGSVLGNVRQRGTAEIDSHSNNHDSARSSMNTSPNYSLTDDIVNHDRDNEEEGHFDLIDEDAYNDEHMPIERSSDSSTIGHNDATGPDLLPVSYRTTNRPQPARRVNSSNYQLRSRTCNRISRNTSSRLRRNVGQQPALTTPRIYRYPGRYSHIPGNSSSGTTSAVTMPLRSSHRSTETTASNFESGSNARRYYRGSHLRVSRRSNSNSANSSLTTEPRTSALSRRTRLARTHNQLFSHLRSTVRAIETNPSENKNKSERCNEEQGIATRLSIKREERNRHDTKNQNSNTSTIGKKATKLLQIKNSSNKHCSVACKSKSLKNNKSDIMLTRSTKEELRALSQRLERLLKEKRENESLEISTTPSSPDLPSSTSNINSEQSQQMNETMTEGEKYLLSLPRPDPRLSSPNGSSLSDPRLRWRHLMEGIDEHILNDPMPPRRSVRYGVQRHNSSHYREQDFYVRQNYRSQRRDSSPLTSRNRTSRPTHPSFSLVDGTLPSVELGTDSGSDTDDPNLNSNDSREFPHNSSLEWNGGTSSSPLFRHGFGRWPVRRMSRREELMDISGFGRNLNRNQIEYASLLSPNRNYENEELEERWREDRRRIRNRASARLSRMRLLERTTAYDYSAENNSVENNLNPDDNTNRYYREYLARARSPVTTAYNPSSADAGTSNNELPSDNQDIGVNINTDPATLDIDRLPPLRELIWRRLRRRNAQLNMLENEIAGTRNHTRPNDSRSELDRSLLNQENNESSSNGNSVGRDINRPHREFLTWMVDQMRLDHESNTTHSSVRRDEQSERVEGMDNNSLNEEDTEQASVDPSTRHISFSREFITPPPIQYRHRYTNLQENNEDTNVSLNDGLSTNGSRTARQEERSRPSSYAAAAVNGLIARNSISGSNAANNAQTNATAATFQREHYYLHNAPANMLLTHRIQSWDFHKDHIPDLRDSSSNLVVNEARIHNDASVDISEDGSILVTLIPSNMPMTTVVGVYGLKPDINRGRCYAHFSLESSAVSVSLSPTSRYLLVGLAVRTGRLILSPTERTLMGQIFRIQLPHERNAERGRLVHRKDLNQTEPGQTSLNCIRWIPVAGQGIVYATNTGLLKILR